MTREIQFHALVETLVAQQGLVHAHHLGAFFVDGDGVKVVDLDVGIRAYRMRHRARIFRKLRLAQYAHIIDALYCTSGFGTDHVGGKFLIAEYR